jgi:hypothetical protein
MENDENSIIALLLSWNLYFARSIIFPLKLTAVACHEGWYATPSFLFSLPPLLTAPSTPTLTRSLPSRSHAIMGVLTGGRIESIVLDPNQGGATTTIRGWAFLSLPAGCTSPSSLLTFFTSPSSSTSLVADALHE